MSDALAPVAAKTGAAGDTAFDVAIKAAQDDIHAGVEKAGLRNDPIRYPLAAISTAIGLFPDFLRQMQDTAERARQPLDAAALARMEKAAAEGASHASAALVRAHNRRSVIIGSLVLAGCIAAALAGGYWWGRREAIWRFSVAEAGFASLMRDQPEAATAWLQVAQLNDLPKVLAICRDKNPIVQPDGRRACLAPLWLEAPKVFRAPPTP